MVPIISFRDARGLVGSVEEGHDLAIDNASSSTCCANRLNTGYNMCWQLKVVGNAM